MKLDRASGILLHPTSLSSKYGIGDMGPEAYKFIDFLKRSKQRLWQVLPLNPVGYGWSPYQSPSAFAGNHLLLSIDILREEGLLTAEDIGSIPPFPEDMVQFPLVAEFKDRLLRKAFAKFNTGEKSPAYEAFREENAYWLEDFVLFMALRRHFGGLAWNSWKRAIAFREKEAILYYQKNLHEEIAYHCFLQFKFFKQWTDLKRYANAQGIKIIGDLPIFISYDSSDTWANPRLFALDDRGNPVKVAGVPPDYFSETGQLWGNPHYDWAEMEKDDYQWWRKRFEYLLKLADFVRVDHFRGFEAYWEIPAGESTAVNGRWVKGPGEKFFFTIRRYLGELPVIAEDLGVITPEVVELKEKCGFPGMKVLQFLAEEELERESGEEEIVYYTGTHDNDTLLGWYRKKILSQLDSPESGHNEEEKCWEYIELVFCSRAKWAIVPLQDVLCLDNEARMNTPGTVDGNWQWRFREGALTSGLEKRLALLTLKYQRYRER
ncbi:4-alpha-glucanotransferase [Thermanaerosceptrum fracticalcis]|uniref:4-alpha-glucanotransferase n=1 Tax=Thermanaerosceptrum fracticalcis TaxID=1712410 RepID=A0A7G6DYT7_THEFR|nr:4-alpha-glucanotransferase [Thermanaerosceptrum fracticalcis]QNB44991.1 4-alpha-glucanotransferase [Thermanaerosceptrum fracticalcis]